MEVFYKILDPTSLHRQVFYLLTTLKEHYSIQNEGSHKENCLTMNLLLQRAQTKVRNPSQHLSVQSCLSCLYFLLIQLSEMFFKFNYWNFSSYFSWCSSLPRIFFILKGVTAHHVTSGCNLHFDETRHLHMLVFAEG